MLFASTMHELSKFPSFYLFIYLFFFFFQEQDKYGSGYKRPFNDKFAFIFSFE